MTPKEKAIELVDKFYQRFPLEMDVVTTRGDLSWEYDNWKEAKQSALIAVDGILNNFGSRVGDKTHYCNYLTIQYYEEVKQEIEKL
jgi:hypothetical protein